MSPRLAVYVNLFFVYCFIYLFVVSYRIETVMSSDRILVMEQGSVRELGTPEQLLDNPDSLFTALFREHCKQMNAHGSD